MHMATRRKPRLMLCPSVGRRGLRQRREALRRLAMPKGSKVHKVYEALLRQGYTKAQAARIAQKQTGQALQTGKPPKRKRHG